MKKFVLLTIGLIFAVQLVAVAKEDKGKNDKPKNPVSIARHIENEEREHGDISPTHGKGHDKKDKHDDNRNHDKH